jgi:hypothetical protein
MPYAGSVLGRDPYAGRGLLSQAVRPPGWQANPPPIPGGTATFVYEPHPIFTLARRGYAGLQSLTTYLGGGISLAPDHARAVMRVACWWPDAPLLTLFRIHPDGSQYPVRGASPLRAVVDTRRNYCSNPSFEVGLNGWLADAGVPVLSRLDNSVVGVTVARGRYALRATIAAAGSCGVTMPTTLPANPTTPATGGVITVACDLRLSARPAGLTVQVSWTAAGGGALGPYTTALTPNQINASVAQWARQRVELTDPAGASNPVIKLIATGLPAGASMDVDGGVQERGSTSGGYFDGATAGGLWTGTAGLSTSVLAPVLTVDDGEAPLDVPVRYLLYNPQPVGGTMRSELASLISDDRAWLTHPDHPGAPIVVTVRDVPDDVEDLDRSVQRILDSPYPVVITSSYRWAASGEITFGALSLEERAQLDALLADPGRPVLLRTPATYGYGSGRWITLGAKTTSAGGRRVDQPTRMLTFPYDVVDAPAMPTT